MTDQGKFLILMAVSTAVLCAVIWTVAPASARKSPLVVAFVGALVSGGGMMFAKFGAVHGWPPALYYGAPAALTMFGPPLLFRMPPARSSLYVVLAFLSAPAIHFGALWLLGWSEYMPFLNRGA